MHNRRQEFRDSGQPVGIDGNLGVARITQNGKSMQLSTFRIEGTSFGCQLIKTEEDPNTERLRLTFRFSGIDLRETRFMVATAYLVVEDSDSTVFARLGNNRILVGATFGDVVAWELRAGNNNHTVPRESYIPQLVFFNPKKVGVSILSPNSLMLGYPLR